MVNWNKILEGKAILIYGGTRGIGRAVALEAARQGADVVIGGRDTAAAEEIIAEIRGLGQQAVFVRIDPLNHPEDCKAAVETAVREFGKIDGLFNYAGLTTCAPITESTPELFHEIFTLNTMAPLLLSGAAISEMQKTGGGSIVQMGSPHAWAAEKDRTVYGMSKGALLTMNEHIAKHYSCDHIRCNYVTMGWVPTDGELKLRAEMYGMNTEELHEFAKPFIPSGRMQTVEDHVPGIIYLLSDLSEQVTGSNLRVTGGFYI